MGNSPLALNSQGNTATPNGVLNFDTGTHTISASYSGDTSFNPSVTTQSQSFTITPGFFIATSNQATVIVSAPGSTNSTPFTVASSTGFSGNITFACSGLPTGATCQFNPSSITATSTPVTTQGSVTVSTTGTTTAALNPLRNLFPARWMAFAGLMFFSVVMIGAPGRRHTATFLLFMAAFIVLMPGCGGGSSTPPPPPPPPPATAIGEYNITVTASGGGITSTTGFTLVVQ